MIYDGQIFVVHPVLMFCLVRASFTLKSDELIEAEDSPERPDHAVHQPKPTIPSGELIAHNYVTLKPMHL